MKYSSKKKLLMLFLLIAVLIMGIGYASINPITGEINGTAIANVQNGVFITDVEYVSDIEANLSNSRIDNFLGTMLKSTVELSNTNPSSEIKYKVTVHNNSTETMLFVGVVYDEDFYDNVEITFEINEGFDVGETKEIYITYKYKETSTVTENNVLKSYLNFKMSKPNRMITAENVGETELYLTSSLVKNKIESIKFEKGTELTDSTKIIARFDASEKQDESIIGYYTDIDNNGLYELTFLSEENIYANQNAHYLFQSLTKLKDIQFENFSTFGVKRMENLFNNCSSLQHN